MEGAQTFRVIEGTGGWFGPPSAVSVELVDRGVVVNIIRQVI